MKIILNGYKGRIGSVIYDYLYNKKYDVEGFDLDKPITDQTEFDIAIDFSSPAGALKLFYLCLEKNKPLIIGTTFDRNLVRQNIEIRLKERLDNGLVEEVEGLYNSGFSWERLEKLGLEYRFCSLFLQGKIKSKDELFEKLNIAIRQFAKRQETWFRGMEAKGVEINWLPAVQDKNVRISAALSLVEKYFKQ